MNWWWHSIQTLYRMLIFLRGNDYFENLKFFAKQQLFWVLKAIFLVKQFYLEILKLFSKYQEGSPHPAQAFVVTTRYNSYRDKRFSLLKLCACMTGRRQSRRLARSRAVYVAAQTLIPKQQFDWVNTGNIFNVVMLDIIWCQTFVITQLSKGCSELGFAMLEMIGLCLINWFFVWF